jgi:ligand-binding sensor protein
MASKNPAGPAPGKQRKHSMKFTEMVDIKELQALCESFTRVTGGVTAILDLEGNILAQSGWKDICTRFHREHPVASLRCRESDTILAGQLKNGETYNVYKCKNGLVDVATLTRDRLSSRRKNSV